MADGFIINLTPTGMIPTRAMTPHVPITPSEIIAQVNEAAALGVNMVHLHARDAGTGEPTWRPEVYATIIAGIRERHPDLVLCVSTSGRTFGEFAQRSAVLQLKNDLKPDFGSLTLSSLNFNREASMNSPQMIQDLARVMRDNGIRPELEAFDLGMVNYAHYLIRKELLQPPYYANLILGNIACAQADLMHLGLMIRELPPDTTWSVGGIGDAQLRMNAAGLIGGGGVRIGLEDSIYLDAGRARLATNRELVERILTVASALDLRPFSHREARERLCPRSR